MGQIEREGGGLQSSVGMPNVPVPGGRGARCGSGSPLGGCLPGIGDGTLAAMVLSIEWGDLVCPGMVLAIAASDGALGIRCALEHC